MDEEVMVAPSSSVKEEHAETPAHKEAHPSPVCRRCPQFRENELELWDSHTPAHPLVPWMSSRDSLQNSAFPDMRNISNKVTGSYLFLLPQMKLERKRAERFQILIVTNYTQTHKIAKQHPRPN